MMLVPLLNCAKCLITESRRSYVFTNVPTRAPWHSCLTDVFALLVYHRFHDCLPPVCHLILLFVFTAKPRVLFVVVVVVFLLF